MAKNKTETNDTDVYEFIETFSNSEQKKKDSLELIELMRNVSGFEPKMYGPSIVGFGNYHYKYESGHEGDAPLLGFSPRKAAISLYTFTGLEEHEHLLQDLGKLKMGKACIYVNKLSDIDLSVLDKMMKETVQFLEEKYGEN